CSYRWTAKNTTNKQAPNWSHLATTPARPLAGYVNLLWNAACQEHAKKFSISRLGLSAGAIISISVRRIETSHVQNREAAGEHLPRHIPRPRNPNSRWLL